jgi:hypothetical protein
VRDSVPGAPLPPRLDALAVRRDQRMRNGCGEDGQLPDVRWASVGPRAPEPEEGGGGPVGIRDGAAVLGDLQASDGATPSHWPRNSPGADVHGRRPDRHLPDLRGDTHARPLTSAWWELAGQPDTHTLAADGPDTAVAARSESGRASPRRRRKQRGSRCPRRRTLDLWLHPQAVAYSRAVNQPAPRRGTNTVEKTSIAAPASSAIPATTARTLSPSELIAGTSASCSSRRRGRVRPTARQRARAARTPPHAWAGAARGRPG